MKTKTIISIFCILHLNVFAQVNPGIYHAYQNGRPKGLYLFNNDSTFLFAGFFKPGGQSVIKGKWGVLQNCLQLNYNATYTNYLNNKLNESSLKYEATTTAPYDSIFFDIEVTDSLAKVSGSQIVFPNLLIANTNSNGKLKIAFPIHRDNEINSIKISEGIKNLHVNDGSYEGVSIVLSAENNHHKIKVARAPKKGSSFQIIDKGWTDEICKMQLNNDKISFLGNAFELRSITDSNTVRTYFKNLKIYYPYLSKYLLNVEKEFVKFF